ncbi:hypothetical protein OKW33_002234 [Paraburkholderia atlantica]|uniref:DUF2778 domain-containing protein n=1 Tax=Paraburkholderia atlantica TaxID=2654982 RepID=UPI001D0FF0E6|nr:DUF2778 domain-containing protein [Paraburkholderia atlantica]
MMQLFCAPLRRALFAQAREVANPQSSCSAPVGPAGKYWIVDQPTGGLGSQALALAKDTWNAAWGSPTNHNEWFALYRDDGSIDDFTWVNGVKRGHFRLHPAGGEGASLGCITLPSRADFLVIRNSLLNTSTILTGRPGLRAYGTIEVITYGNTCP